MINRILSRQPRLLVLALGLLAATSATTLAQETQTFEPATVVLTAADGTTSDYAVSDISIYVSTTAGYDDVPATIDFSLSLSTITPLDEALLEWSSQTAGKASVLRDIAITGSVTDADGQSREMQYDITKAQVTSVSINHSTYAQPSVSLSIVAGKLRIDGVMMN